MSDTPSDIEELPEDVRAMLRAEQLGPGAPEGARDMVLDRVFETLALPTPPAAPPPPAPIAAPVLASSALRALVASVTVVSAIGLTIAYRSTRERTAPQRTPIEQPAHREPAQTTAPDRTARASTVAPTPASEPPIVVAPTAPPSTRPATRQRSAEEAPEELAEEQRLLAEGQRALAARNVDAVLSAVRAHAQRFSRGALAEERDALEIRALLVAQRTDEARARAARFRRRYPDSVFSVEIEQRLGAP